MTLWICVCVCVLLLAQWGEKGKLGGGGGATAESETYPQPFRFGRRIKAHFSFYKQQQQLGPLSFCLKNASEGRPFS